MRVKKRIFVWANLGISVAIFTSPLDTKAQSLQPLSTVHLGAYIGAASNRRLDFFKILNRHTFVTTTPQSSAIHCIDFWDLQSGRIKNRIVPPEPVSYVQLSPDTRRLIATQAILGDLKHKIYSPHKLFVWSARTKKMLRVIDFGAHFFVREVAFWPGKAEQVIIQISAPNGSQQHFLHLDLNTGYFGKPIHYPAAQYLFHDFWGYFVLSPDRKLLASVYEMGEGFAGSIDIVDVETGQVRVHHVAEGDNPIYGASFFLSPKRFFFGSWPEIDPYKPIFAGYSFDITKPKLKLRGESKLRCLAAVPSRLGQGFFLSKYGLELWDIARQERLRRWPRLKDVEQIAIARDGKTVGFYYGQEQDDRQINPRQPFKVAAQFWRF